MLIIPYKNKKSESLYFRIKLNKQDIDFINNNENFIYQIKCIGATQKIFELKSEFNTRNLEFDDRLFPSIPPGERKRKKAEFGLMLTNKQKRNFSTVLKIEFYKNKLIRFKDIYILNKIGEMLKYFNEPRNELILALELENIYEILLSLPKRTELCKTCKYFYEYQANGYCIKYHPDSGIPSDF